MDGLRVRALRAAAISVVVAGLAAGPALAAPGVHVGSLSSLQAGAQAGTLHGVVVNRSSHAVNANVSVRLQSRAAKIVARTTVRVPANGKAGYRVAVKVPSGLSRGNYYFAACTPIDGDGNLSCATSSKEVRIDGGFPVRGSAVRLPTAFKGARSAQAETCTSGGHTLAPVGDVVYPELGNTGYSSVHSDVYINYDALADLMLPGTHVDLQQRSTQCLSDFSLDFNTANHTTTNPPGPNLTVSSITVNGQPATFKFVQPTYPGDPNGQDDPDPLAHRSGLAKPINASNPNPPACAPYSNNQAANQNVPCDANKLVITPSAPIPSGTDFTVTVNYSGRPGVRPSPTGTEGWFQNTKVGFEGAMVTSEPTGTSSWMPLNNHPSVKPTYDIYDTVTKGKTTVGPGRLISSADNAPDANFPGGSSSYHWKSSEPIANYLVENSVGSFDYSFRTGANDVVYFEAQDSSASRRRARRSTSSRWTSRRTSPTSRRSSRARSRSTPTASWSPTPRPPSRRRCRRRSSSSAARSAARRARASAPSPTRTTTSGGATTSPRAARS